LSPKFLLRGSSKEAVPGPLGGDNVEWLFCGTAATYRAIRSLHLEIGDVVLMPDYNCGIEVDGVLEAGASVEFYKVRRDASIDIDDLKSKASGRVRVVFVIHYFGFPQPIEEVLDLTKARDLTLIEDCAHSLFSMNNGHYLGTFGDLSIFSIRKTLPLMDGGALVTNKGRTSQQPVQKPRWRHTAREFFNSIGRRGEMQKNIFLRGTGRLLRITVSRLASRCVDEMPLSEVGSQNFLNVRKRLNWGMSSFSKRLFYGTDHQEVISRRRENFLSLLGQLCGRELMYPLFSVLPDGVCPWIFPLVVHERDRIYKHMNERGIEIFRLWWWGHPLIPQGGNPDATFLRDNLLALPIHQDLTEAELSNLASALKKIIR